MLRTAELSIQLMNVIKYQPGTGLRVYASTVPTVINVNNLTTSYMSGSNPGVDIASFGANITGTVDNSSSHHNYADGFIFESNGVTKVTLTLNNCNAYSNGTVGGIRGYYIQNNSDITFIGGSAYDNWKDGISNNSTGIVHATAFKSYNNGARDTSDNNGNGFTGHETSQTYLYNPIAFGNTKAAVGFIDTTTGLCYNGSFYNNVGRGSTKYGDLYFNTTGSWTVKNTTRCI